MKKFTKKVLPTLAVLALLSACGGEKGSSSKDSSTGGRETAEPEEHAAVDGSNIQGFYLANFGTLNGHVVGMIPGSASFTRKEDRLFVYLRLFAGSPKAWHMQAVYEGNRCPTMKDDTNGDGFIDINEAHAVLGKIIIPLDSDPGTQSSGRNFYPLGDLSGSYHYERVVSFNRFFRDLQSEDKDPADNIAKLGPDQGLQLEGRPIMILGIGEDIELPETVGTLERRQPFQTLPIACGIYQKVEQTPGTPYVTDQIPGPIAEVDENQDRPAPENEGESTGSSSGTTTGGTNESDDGQGPVSDGNSGSATGSSSGGSSSGGTSTGNTSGGTNGETTGGTTGESSTTGGTTGGRTSGWTGGGWTGGRWTGGSSGGFVGGFVGGSSGGRTSGGSGGSTTSGGSGSSSETTTTTSDSSSDTSTTTGSSSSGSGSSSSDGTNTDNSLDSSSGV